MNELILVVLNPFYKLIELFIFITISAPCVIKAYCCEKNLDNLVLFNSVKYLPFPNHTIRFYLFFKYNYYSIYGHNVEIMRYSPDKVLEIRTNVNNTYISNNINIITSLAEFTSYLAVTTYVSKMPGKYKCTVDSIFIKLINQKIDGIIIAESIIPNIKMGVNTCTVLLYNRYNQNIGKVKVFWNIKPRLVRFKIDKQNKRERSISPTSL